MHAARWQYAHFFFCFFISWRSVRSSSARRFPPRRLLRIEFLEAAGFSATLFGDE